MPWVPRIPPKGEADADSSAPREKAAAPKEKPAAEETESAESRAQREKAQSYLAMRGAELWLDLQQRKLQGKKMTKFLTDELYAEIKKQLENPKKPDRPCWYFNIDVSATELTAEGLKILVAFLKRLYQANPPVCVHSLRCYNNDLGNEGAEQIAELILAQPYAISELHLSHSRMTELGAATVILSVCVANDRYPFQVKHRWTGCWIRLENNHVSAPDALLTAMRATLLPGKEWDEQMVHIEAIARGDRTWGRAHGPHWATSAEVTPQALLYTFHEQQGVLDAGYGKKESVAGIRAARRATDSAREAVLEMHKKLNDHDDYDNQQGTHRPARVRLSEDRVVVARYRRGADEVPEKKEEAWVPEPKRVAKIHDTRPFRMAVDSLKPLADSREAPASSTRWVTYGKGGKVGSGTAVAAPASTTRRSHEAHEYANAIGSGGGKGESPPKGSKGAAPKGKQLNVTQPKEEDHSIATASSPPTAATAAGKGAVQKGKGRSKDAGKLVWKSKVTKAPEESSKEEQRPEAAPKVESSKASTSTDVKEPQATSKDAKSARDVEKAEDPKEAKAAKEAKDAGKDANEAKDAKAAGAKEVKDSKEAAATKESKDAHEAKATEAKDANEAKDAKVMAAKEAKDSKEVKAKEAKDTQEAKDEQATPVKEAKEMKDEKGASTKTPADSKAKHTEHVQATKPAAKAGSSRPADPNKAAGQAAAKDLKATATTSPAPAPASRPPPVAPASTAEAAQPDVPTVIPFQSGQSSHLPPQKAKTGKNKIVMPTGEQKKLSSCVSMRTSVHPLAHSVVLAHSTTLPQPFVLDRPAFQPRKTQPKMQPDLDSVETPETASTIQEGGGKKCHLKTRLGYQPLHRVLIDNWQSGLTVAMVSVPLSISLGIASVSGGDPAAPLMGVSTAFWGGLCASMFSSSDFNIIGPAGALSGMLNSATIKFGGAGVLPYLSLLSSAIIFLIYLLGLQRYLLLMPTAVFEGFTLAVAFIIGLGQLEMALDLSPDGPKSEHFHENVIRSIEALHGYSLAPAILFFVVTALLLTLVKYAGKIRGRSIPWTVLIPLLTILLGYLSDHEMLFGIILPTLKDKYGTLQARIVEVPSVPLAEFAAGDVLGLLRTAFGIAFVAILETLISAKIAEQRMNYPFESGRETFGLMVCHAVCGAVGALPPTGVFVRTSLNVQLGATHRLSQFINAVAVFLIFMVAMPVFSYLPQAAVAALLVFASIRMAPVHYIATLWRTDKRSCFLLVLTTAICVFVDPVYGLIVGMVVALLRDAAETARAESRVTLDKSEVAVSDTGTPLSRQHATLSHWATSSFDDGANLAVKPSPLTRLRQLVESFACGKSPEKSSNALHKHETFQGAVIYEPMGSVTFLCASKHLSRLQALLVKKPTKIIISLEHVTRIDIDGCDSLAKAAKEIKEAGCDVRLVVSELLLQGTILQKAAWVEHLRSDGCVYSTVADAKLQMADI